MFPAVKKLSNVLCLVALCITISAPAMAKDKVSTDFPVAYRSDNQLAEEVAHAIRMYPWYDIFDWVEGTVHNGVVTLTGAVREPFHKDDYGKIVARIPGVKQVHNVYLEQGTETGIMAFLALTGFAGLLTGYLMWAAWRANGAGSTRPSPRGRGAAG